MIENADLTVIDRMVEPVNGGLLAGQADEINRLFAGAALGDIAAALENSGTEFGEATAKKIARPSPLAMSCALETIRAGRTGGLIEALRREFRFSYRAQEQGDFIEGIRAQIIDRDFAPKWRHKDFHVPQGDIDAMLADLGTQDWRET